MLNPQQTLLGNTFHYIDFSKAEREMGYSHNRRDLENAIDKTIEGLIFS